MSNNSIAEWNLRAKMERDMIDFSKVRELQRDGHGLTLHGKSVEVVSCCKPEIVSSSGYATRYFNGEEDILKGVYVEIEKRCTILGTDCYEVGKNLITWSSDPGFGSRTENYVVQFYTVGKRVEHLEAELSHCRAMMHTNQRLLSEERIARDGGFRHY
jgi:hypothetical protein